MFTQDLKEEIFPELKESEDERIRKELIEFVKSRAGFKQEYIIWLEKQSKENMIEALRLEYEKGKSDVLQEQRKEWTSEDLLNRNEIMDILQEYNRDDLIDWLEKQDNEPKWCHHKVDLSDCSDEYRKAYYDGWNNCNLQWQHWLDDNHINVGERFDYQHANIPQNSFAYIESKFHEGDFIKHNKANIICKVISVNSGSYYVENVGTSGRIELFNAEQNFHLWTIQDAKDGDVLVCEGREYLLFKSFSITDGRIKLYGWYNGQTNNFHVGTDVKLRREANIYPATKEQCYFLFQKMMEEIYEWDEQKKELNKIKQKPAWSYEDEANLNNIIWLCNNCINGSETTWIPSQATKIKHLIETIKERGLTQQKPAEWSKEDEERIKNILSVLDVQVCWNGATGKKENPYQKEIDWLKSLKDRCA